MNRPRGMFLKLFTRPTYSSYFIRKYKEVTPWKYKDRNLEIECNQLSSKIRCVWTSARQKRRRCGSILVSDQ